MENIGQYKFEPLYDRVLVQRDETKIETAGGLYIPDSAKEKPSQGRVIAVGNGRIRDDGGLTPLATRVGDKVIFGKYAGTDIKLNENEYLLMREEDILGIIR